MKCQNLWAIVGLVQFDLILREVQIQTLSIYTTINVQITNVQKRNNADYQTEGSFVFRQKFVRVNRTQSIARSVRA